MQISTWFIVVFILMLIAGPFTQLLQLAAPEFHRKLGLMEADAFKPEFRWFLLEEKAIAIADMTYLLAGAIFVVLSLNGNSTALVFGLYTCACYVYFGSVYIPRVLLLRKNGMSPVPKRQLAAYIGYVGLFLAYGLFGMLYLWGLVQEKL